MDLCFPDRVSGCRVGLCLGLVASARNSLQCMKSFSGVRNFFWIRIFHIKKAVLGKKLWFTNYKCFFFFLLWLYPQHIVVPYGRPGIETEPQL